MEAEIEVGATLDPKDDNLIGMVKYVGDREGFSEIVNKMTTSISNKLSDESKPLEASSLEAKLSKGKLLVLGTINGRVIQEIWWVKDWNKFKHPLDKPELLNTQEEEINEVNKIIAEFMGATKNTFGDIILPQYEDESFAVFHLRYHTSWDWLMPVHRKITEIGLWMVTNKYDQLWYEKSKKIDTAILTEETPLKAAGLIAALIEWHKSV